MTNPEYAICPICKTRMTDHGPESFIRHSLLAEPNEPVVIILREDAEALLRLLDSYRVTTSYEAGSNVVCIWAPNIICPEHHVIHGGITG